MLSPGAVLQSNAASVPDKTALLCGDEKMSWQELDQSTTGLACWFLNQGMQPGDRVAVHWTNAIPAVQLFYGLFKAGLVAVPVNTRLKPPEISFVLKHSGARMCFSENMLLPLVQQSGAQCPLMSELPETSSASSSQLALPSIDPDAPALLMYTSGTTARPKGVIHTHRSLFHTGAQVIEALKFTRPNDETQLCVLPLMHMGAFSASVGSIITAGRLVLLPRFDPGAVLDAVEKFHCSVVASMPALWHLILNEQVQRPRRIDALKIAAAAGDAVPVPLQERFKAVFGIPLLEAYGMTESVPISMNPSDANRPGSMGVCIKGVRLRIAGVDSTDVATGGTGEILVRSAANCSGYWNDPEATQLAFKNDWLHTGDLGSCDSDGYYWFRGRMKEIIVRAGSNISPQEVEESLYRHPAVEQVGVVGQADPVMGEIVVAFVTFRNGLSAEAAELRQFAQTQIADYKVPQQFIFLADLPKSPTGKVNRRALRDSLPGAMSAAGT